MKKKLKENNCKPLFFSIIKMFSSFDFFRSLLRNKIHIRNIYIYYNYETYSIKEWTRAKGRDHKGTEAQGERARMEKHTVWNTACPLKIKCRYFYATHKISWLRPFGNRPFLVFFCLEIGHNELTPVNPLKFMFTLLPN